MRKVRSNCFSLISAMLFFGCCSAALLTRMSSLPSFHCPVDRIFAELLAADVSSDEQAVAAMFLDQAFGFLCVFVFVEITIAMSAPSLAKRIATARPIPLSPPVARATLFWSFPLPPDCASSDFGCGVISYRRPGC